MDILLFNNSKAVLALEIPDALPSDGFMWIDATHDEVMADPDAWRATVQRATGTQIHELHVKDVLNLQHPSRFDSTNDYELLVFRKLALGAMPNALADTANCEPDPKPKAPPALQKLVTVPVSFLLMERVLITIRPSDSRTIDAARARLLEHRQRSDNTGYGSRLSSSPQELMLRLVNAMVDQYLELRHPLTAQLDRWQRALLNPRRPFNDWSALLDARNQLHKLDHLCEEQHDALQELRDHFVDAYHGSAHMGAKDMLLVRINDVMEHVTRVLNHARRLEMSLESAVQIHFASMAHRTSEIMRTLTVLTALFMPMTLITGIFGMNFIDMPLLQARTGFWTAMSAMAAIAIGFLIFFWRKRYLDD